MEGPQGGRTPAHHKVRCLLEEQGGDEPSCRVVAASSHSGGEMGEHIDGFHHRVSCGARQGLYLCRRLLTDKVCAFFRHIHALHNSIGGQVVLPGYF